MKLANMLVNFFGISQLPTQYSDNLIEKHRSWKYLNHKMCGVSINSNFEPESSGRIIGGKNAPLASYPWIVRLGYLIHVSSWYDEPIKYLDCGGSIISEYYVITAAHCLPSRGRERIDSDCARSYYMSLDFVRLGEHNVDTDPDCANSSFCADPYKDYTIRQIIKHEYYNSRTIVNDVALIRVRKRIGFTRFIRPICLLRGTLLKKDFADQASLVAGWGICDISTGEASKVLKVVELPILPQQLCQAMWGRLNPGQLCAGGTIGKDSCNGDSGGPLMLAERVDLDQHWGTHLLGIVSYGPRDCGARRIPGIYTRVSHYTLWILDNIRG